MLRRGDDRRVGRVRVNYAADLGIGSIHFTVDRKLVMSFAFAGQGVAVEVDQYQVVFGYFFQADS